jgi:integrase
MRIKIFREKTNQDADVFMPAELFEKIRKAYQGKKFLFEVKGKAISRYTIHTLIKEAGEKIDRAELHAHPLRHTWATLALPVLGLSKVSKYLSHSTPDTTAKYYLHGKASAGEVMACNMLQLAL